MQADNVKRYVNSRGDPRSRGRGCGYTPRFSHFASRDTSQQPHQPYIPGQQHNPNQQQQQLPQQQQQLPQQQQQQRQQQQHQHQLTNTHSTPNALWCQFPGLPAGGNMPWLGQLQMPQHGVNYMSSCQNTHQQGKQPQAPMHANLATQNPFGTHQPDGADSQAQLSGPGISDSMSIWFKM